MIELLREVAPILGVLISAAVFLLIYRHGGYAAGYRRGYADASKDSRIAIDKESYDRGKADGYREGLGMSVMWKKDAMDREHAAILREELEEQRNRDNKE